MRPHTIIIFICRGRKTASHANFARHTPFRVSRAHSSYTYTCIENPLDDLSLTVFSPAHCEIVASSCRLQATYSRAPLDLATRRMDIRQKLHSSKMRLTAIHSIFRQQFNSMALKIRAEINLYRLVFIGLLRIRKLREFLANCITAHNDRCPGKIQQTI